MTFHDFIDELKRIDKLGGIDEALQGLTKSYCLQNFAYLYIPVKANLKIPAEPILINNYPTEWVEIYKKYNYELIDPVVKQIYRQDKPLLWNEFINASSLSNEQTQMLEDAKQYGIINGITCPIVRAGFEFSTFTFLVKPNSTNDQLENIRYYLPIIATAIHTKAKSFFSSYNAISAAKFIISDREIECLIWSAKGKTTWEIAKILAISEHTVNTHMKNSMNKLNAATKTEAVVKAMLLKYITLFDIFNK